MNLRERLGCLGVGTVMMVGALVSFPGTAHAAQGDLTMAGTFVMGSSISGTGTGTILPGSTFSAGSRSGTTTAVGTVGGFLTTSITASDTITWSSPIATQVMTNVVIVIDSTTAPLPPQGVCVLSLANAQGFSSSNWVRSNPTATSKFMSGSFTSNSSPMGNYTLTEGMNCYSSGLASQVRSSIGDLSGTGFASNPLGGSLTKSLQVLS